jgi:thiol-disulfide isomerase/thioredoxin
MQRTQQNEGMVAAMRSIAALSLVLLGCLLCGASRAEGKYSFSLKDISTGDSFDLTSLTEDRPLVLLVWSPHCPHCQRHMPYFAGLYSKVDLDSVNVATIAVDCSRDDALDYITRKKLSFPVLLGKSGKVSDGFYKDGWPTTYVFGAGGSYAGTIDSTGPPYINDVLALIDKAEQQ